MPPEIPKPDELEQEVFQVNENTFNSIALKVFSFQYHNNSLYRKFADAIGRHPGNVHLVKEIPFLPISFFKSHEVKTSAFEPEAVFESSGTTGLERSRHLLRSTALYKKSFLKAFELFFGSVKEFCILGLLPSYLERSNSSLVFMVNELVQVSGHPSGGFYLYEHEQLSQVLKKLEAAAQKTVLFGVSYALLDFASAFPMPLKHTLVIETGGMKGRREEMSKNELYASLQKSFSAKRIFSEYGMTELLSQAYAINGKYKSPPWMQLLLRDETDPLNVDASSGVINVVDLANIYSCSFIATDDAGRWNKNELEIIGRTDNSSLRGCSLMVAE